MRVKNSFSKSPAGRGNSSDVEGRRAAASSLIGLPLGRYCPAEGDARRAYFLRNFRSDLANRRKCDLEVGMDASPKTAHIPEVEESRRDHVSTEFGIKSSQRPKKRVSGLQ